MATNWRVRKNENIPASVKVSIEGGVDQVAKVVNQKEVCFLRGAAGVARDDEVNRGQAFCFTAVATEKGDALEAQFVAGA